MISDYQAYCFYDSPGGSKSSMIVVLHPAILDMTTSTFYKYDNRLRPTTHMTTLKTTNTESTAARAITHTPATRRRSLGFTVLLRLTIRQWMLGILRLGNTTIAGIPHTTNFQTTMVAVPYALCNFCRNAGGVQNI